MRTLAAPWVVLALALIGATATWAQPEGQRPAGRQRGRQQVARVPQPQGTTPHRDIAYIADGDERHLLDLYIPESGSNWPLIVGVHGGGWRNGSKEGCRVVTKSPLPGYALASLNYRLSQHAAFPAQLEDCKAAIRWLRANADKYGYDTSRIGVWGGSAGGHLVALLGTTGDVKQFDIGPHLEVSSRVQAVCDFYGPTDFLRFVTTPGYEKHADVKSPESRLLGAEVEDVPERVKQANSITYVSQDDPPFLIVHGDADRTVPLNQSELLHAALQKAGIEVQFHVIKGGGHGGPEFNSPEIHGMVRAFFDQHLKSRTPPSDSAETKSSKTEAPPSQSRPDVRTAPPRSSSDVRLEHEDANGECTGAPNPVAPASRLAGKAGILLRLAPKERATNADYLLSHPLVDMPFVKFAWAELNPERDLYDFSGIDAIIDLCKKHNKAMVLGVAPYGKSGGPWTPSWVYSSGVPKITWETYTIPAAWDDRVVAAYSNLIAELGKRYRSEATVGFVMPGFGHLGSTTVQADPDAKDAVLAAGWTPAHWKKYCHRVLDMYGSAFPQTPMLVRGERKLVGDKSRNYFQAELREMYAEFAARGVSVICNGLDPQAETMKKNGVDLLMAAIAPYGRSREIRIGMGDDWPLWVPPERLKGPTRDRNEAGLANEMKYLFGGGDTGLPEFPASMLYCCSTEIRASHPFDENGEPNKNQNVRVFELLQDARKKLKEEDLRQTMRWLQRHR